MSIVFTTCMFIISFAPLWVIVLFVDARSLFYGGDNKHTEIISIVLIFLALLVSFIILWLKIHNKSEENYELCVQEAKESKIVAADYLLCNVLPLLAFDFTQWDGVAMFLVFYSVLWILCIKHKYFGVNVVLEVMNYKTYECTLVNNDKKEIVRYVISKKNLTMHKGNAIAVKPLNNDFFVEKILNNNRSV